MKFDELLNALKTDRTINVRIDSRLVGPGDIFAAIPGSQCDGHDYIGQAVAAGAKYIVAERPVSAEAAEVIMVDNSAVAAALLGQAQKGNPADKLTNLAVTGTNGKTTVAFLVRSIINAAGGKCGLIGTIEYDTGNEVAAAPLTTPDCLTIAELTEKMVEAGCGYAVYEASSHALAQHRLGGVSFRAAAFTNLSGDHLDYHKSQSEYLAAKSLLFEGLDTDAMAVINKQYPQAEQIAQKTKAQILYYAVDAEADISARTISETAGGSRFELSFNGQSKTVKTALLGQYNISNCLAAAGLCIAAGFDLETVAAGLEKARPIPGRLEKVPAPAGAPAVLVDYAHTDDALKNVLQAIKPLCKGNLTVVFGCGGDRDASKRPRMAAVAEQLADKIFITSDNPRSESANYIIGEIVTGFEDPIAESIYAEPDRQKAIELAIKQADADDIILIAGKGHETYQILGDTRIDFDDRKIAAEALKKL